VYVFLEHDGEDSRGTGEIPLPEFVARAGFEGGVEDEFDFGPGG